MRLETRNPLLRAAARSSVTNDGQRIPLDPELLRTALRNVRPLSLRRASYVAAFSGIFVTARSLTQVARQLDEVLDPAYHDQPIEHPTFIFGNGRSGTTLLHRLLSLDDERFAPYQLHQTFIPSVSYRRAVEAVSRVDRHLGAHLTKLVNHIDRRHLTGWEGIHAMGLTKEEEDEALFVYTLLAPGVYLLFPQVYAFDRANWLDFADETTRQRVMAYYENTIKRHLYASGGDRTLLNKNVFLMGRLRTVYRQFPDARLLYLIRHPYQAIPSFVRMFYLAWAAHTPDVREDGPEARALAQLFIDYYRYVHRCRKEIPPEQLQVIKFDDLVADPRGTIERLYAHYGLTITPRYRARLDEATANADGFRSSQHEYSLERFGLSRELIHSQLADVFEEFGFEP